MFTQLYPGKFFFPPGFRALPLMSLPCYPPSHKRVDDYGHKEHPALLVFLSWPEPAYPNSPLVLAFLT